MLNLFVSFIIDTGGPKSFWEEMAPNLLGNFLAAALSFVIALYLYRLEKNRESGIRRADNLTMTKNRRSESIKSWYINILVNPNTYRIEEFFDKLNSTMIDSVDHLNSQKSGSVDAYNSSKAEKIREFKLMLMDFDLTIMQLISSNNDALKEKLLDWKLGFEDIILKYIDTIILDEFEGVHELKPRLSSAKAEFYRILAGPVHLESESNINED